MLRPVLFSLPLLTATVLMGCSKNEPPKVTVEPFTATSSALAEGVFLPAYTRWTDSNRELANSARAFCSGEQPLAAARQQYMAAHKTWAALQPLAIGPLAEGNVTWQVQFWPDKKDLVARQVNEFVDANPQIRQADLEKASVVVQGLTAYEYLLFDKTLDLENLEQKLRYCPLLMSVGSYQQTLSAKVLAGWVGEQGAAAKLRKFPNERYPEAREAIADILRVQVSALEGLKKKLGTPLARGKTPQPYQAEAWRSDASLTLLAAGVASSEAVWRGVDNQGLRQLLGKEHTDLVTRVDGAYTEIRQRLAAMGAPLSSLLADEAGRASLDQLYSTLDQLYRLQGVEVAKALGIAVGFNAHDGD